MIDLHCHLMPEVDDGPKSIEESIRLAHALVADNIDIVVTTPHMLDGVYNVERKNVFALFENLKKKIALEQIDLQVKLGADTHIHPNIEEFIQNGTVPTLAQTKHYILLEPDNNVWDRTIENIVFNLQLKNITPIITHPERFFWVQQDFWRLRSLVEANVLVQVTAASICGLFGTKAKKSSQELFQNGLAHIVASDAHSVERRPPCMTEAKKILEKWLPLEQVELIFYKYPQMILNDEYINVPQPKAKKKKWLFF